MSSLSCAKRSASGPGCTADAGVDERAQHVLRHVLVVEGDDVDLAREGEHGLGVGVVADAVRGERRGHAVGLGEHPEVDAELDGRGNHHPGELPAADHTDPHSCTPFTVAVATACGAWFSLGRGREA